MKYFPEPNELTDQELRDLYRLKRFDEWKSFRSVISRCREKITEQEDNESLRGQANVVFRHIGARTLTGELQEFMEAAEEQLKLLSKTEERKNEKTF
jgi:hypothetical protein